MIRIRHILPIAVLPLLLARCGGTGSPSSTPSASTPEDGSSGPDGRKVAMDTGSPPPPGVYVSQQGNDENDGKTAAGAKRTFDAAIAAAGPSGYVYLTGAYYNERIVINASGTSGAPVTLRPDPAAGGYVDGAKSSPAGTWRNDDLIRVVGSDLIWDGIEIRNSPWNGLDIDGSRITVRNTKIHDIYMQPLASGGDDTLVEDNEVYATELCNLNNANLEGVWGGGIGARFSWDKNRRSARFTARRNKVSNTWGENISAFQVDGFEVSDNDVAPPTAVGIYADNASNGVIERNFIHDGGKNALAFASEHYDYGTNEPPHDITWRNNVGIDGGDIVFVRDGRKTYYNLRFIGNTFVGSELYFDKADEGGVSGCEFVDNVFDGSYFHIADTWNIDHNDWPQTDPQGTHALTADPQYVDASSRTPAGHEIGPTSPLRGAGISRSDLAADYFNVVRPSPPSLGAAEP